MVFSSPFFIFIFLPLVLLLFGIGGRRLQNSTLLLASLFFYAWGNVSHSFIFIFSILFNYAFGILIGNSTGKQSKSLLIIAVASNLLLLGYFKYFNFIAENISGLFYAADAPLQLEKIALPIGISFFTFHALSYIIDVYRKKVSPQRNIIDMGLYMSFFPQLIAGPIVRYIDIESQLKKRNLTIEKATAGLQRFIFGFAKKVIVANSMGYVADQIFNVPPSQISASLSWLGITAYTLQIYFDFSGYSDMAIGLAKVFGFEFPENFNYPYVARSIKEFWQRWHISLSTWFKDFLYIPLGGNRKGNVRTIINLLIVFFCTGFWHGANWTFVVWGLFHGVFLLIEKFGLERILSKIWNPLRVLYTLLIVMTGWVFFKSETLPAALEYIGRMFFVPSSTQLQILTARDFIDQKVIFILVIGILYSLKVCRFFLSGFEKVSDLLNKQIAFLILFRSSKFLISISLFFITLVYLASGTYNPFIYFRF